MVLQRKLTSKLNDLVSFPIPYTIGNMSFNKCLCDFGASVNFMPLSVYTQLGLPAPKQINISLQLEDRSVTYSRGIVEDILVKVDKFIFPADFIILDYEEEKNITIILESIFSNWENFHLCAKRRVGNESARPRGYIQCFQSYEISYG